MPTTPVDPLDEHLRHAELRAAQNLGVALEEPGSPEPYALPEGDRITVSRRRWFTRALEGPADVALVGIVSIDYASYPRVSLLVTWPGNDVPVWLGVGFAEAADTIDLLRERLCPGEDGLADMLQLWLTRAWAKAAGTVWVQSETTSLYVARELAAQKLEEATISEMVERAVAMVDATKRLGWLQAAQEMD